MMKTFELRCVLLLAVLMTMACVEAGPEADLEDHRALCEDASAHLSACLGQSMPLDPSCDKASAEQISRAPAS